MTSGIVTNWKNRNKIPYEEIFLICENEKKYIKYVFYGINEKNEILINYKKEILEILENSEEKELECFYHMLKAEKLKK